MCGQNKSGKMCGQSCGQFIVHPKVDNPVDNHVDSVVVYTAASNGNTTDCCSSPTHSIRYRAYNTSCIDKLPSMSLGR